MIISVSCFFDISFTFMQQNITKHMGVVSLV